MAIWSWSPRRGAASRTVGPAASGLEVRVPTALSPGAGDPPKHAPGSVATGPTLGGAESGLDSSLASASGLASGLPASPTVRGLLATWAPLDPAAPQCQRTRETPRPLTQGSAVAGMGAWDQWPALEHPRG